MNPMRLKESKQSLKTSKSKKVKFSKDETTTTPPPAFSLNQGDIQP